MEKQNCPYCGTLSYKMDTTHFTSFFCPSCLHGYAFRKTLDCCEAPSFEYRLSKMSNDRPLPRKQCKNCGCVVGTIGVKAKQCFSSVDVLRFEKWKRGYEEEERAFETYAGWVHTSLIRNGIEGKGRYYAYIQKSVCWKSKREQALKRDGYKCTNCGNTASLQVHHITYKNLFNEQPSDLQTLCRDCHESVHNH